MLNIIGGTYIEKCIEPLYCELFGSGLRAAIALSERTSISFHSCIGSKELRAAKYKADLYGINSSFYEIPETTEFHYYHPLSKPQIHSDEFTETQRFVLDETLENTLHYGLYEAQISFKTKRLVYDPQNGIPLNQLNFKVEKIALILNKNEALHFSGLNENSSTNRIGKELLNQNNVEVLVIKDGPQGAMLIFEDKFIPIPVFETKEVWPIGSGDIFSAVFAWEWMIEQNDPKHCAIMASQYTASYCNSKYLPLHLENLTYLHNKGQKKVYLAGPFFSISERWLINELKKCLMDFGNDVYSPFHDTGICKTSKFFSEISAKNFSEIEKSDTVLAVISGLDPGTLVEVGYAKKLGKKIVLFGENIKPEDLLMLIDENCEIVSNISSAVYKSSW